MWISIIYIANVIVGETAVIGLGLYLDRAYPSASLPISLTLFFLVFWLGWVLAVRWTEPRKKTADGSSHA